ncbi:S-phase kinase-associated protein 1-like [Zeugodacus cucurbitae]|uniref:S-phase kinase-associated protein 1-like n=1 Tax=Zeugodacus cucurbitae TaxID=28588 RepID=UPI0023D93C75|nr:S-phase kinase-associated protein 1-like [Zeugodacus cucurbitae]XP_054087061.1 S-phase kinase-associated protein 1-like [Zeugodacus cucurbitae]
MTVILQSNDNVKFLVDVKIAQDMDFLQSMPLNINENDDTIPLPNVDSAILYKVLTWITYHKDNPYIGEDDKPFYISGWDSEFLEVDSDTLYKLIEAADYLGVSGLLELICKTVGYLFSNNAPEEIKSLFNINDSH